MKITIEGEHHYERVGGESMKSRPIELTIETSPGSEYVAISLKAGDLDLIDHVFFDAIELRTVLRAALGVANA